MIEFGRMPSLKHCRCNGQFIFSEACCFLNCRVVLLLPTWLHAGDCTKYLRAVLKEPNEAAFLNRMAQVLKAIITGLNGSIFSVNPCLGFSCSS